MTIVQWERIDSLKQAELLANQISRISNGEEARTNDQPLKEIKQSLRASGGFPHHVTPSDPPHPVGRAVLRGCGMPQDLNRQGDRLPGGAPEE
jgi:hypothetical protein